MQNEWIELFVENENQQYSMVCNMYTPQHTILVNLPSFFFSTHLPPPTLHLPNCLLPFAVFRKPRFSIHNKRKNSVKIFAWHRLDIDRFHRVAVWLAWQPWLGSFGAVRGTSKQYSRQCVILWRLPLSLLNSWTHSNYTCHDMGLKVDAWRKVTVIPCSIDSTWFLYGILWVK